MGFDFCLLNQIAAGDYGSSQGVALMTVFPTQPEAFPQLPAIGTGVGGVPLVYLLPWSYDTIGPRRLVVCTYWHVGKTYHNHWP